VKLNIIKILIITNIAIFLISTGIIFFRITNSQSTTISAKQTIPKEEKVSPSTENTSIIAKPDLEEKQIPGQVVENEIQKPSQTTKPQPVTPRLQDKQDKLVKQQKKGSTTSLAKTEVETAGYMEKEVPTIRNIKFVFFSRQAKKVSLIGDFNDWVPQSLVKVAENRWEITLKIPAGQDYLYNFLVDGKVIIDPNNKKPPQISPQGFKSSVLSL